MLKLKRAFVFALVVLVFAFGIYLGVRMERTGGPGGGARTINTPVLLQQVQTLSELVTV